MYNSMNTMSNNMFNKQDEAGSGCGDQSNDNSIDKTKLIVNYLPQFATENDLAQLFSPIGQIEDIKIIRDFKTGYSFGFGFVKYIKSEDAAKAIQVLNGMNFRNKRLKVSYSRPQNSDSKDANLYITNLPKETTEDDVDNLFSSFGEIIQRNVLKDKITGLPRGVAFVRFSKSEEAQAAIAGLDGKLLNNAMFPLSVRVAEDHGRQKAQFLDNSQYMHHVRGPPPSPHLRGMPFRQLSGPTRNYRSQYYGENTMDGSGDAYYPTSYF